MSANPRIPPELAISRNRDPSNWAGMIVSTLAILALVTVLCTGISMYSYKATVAVAGLAVGGLILWNPFIGILVVVASLPFETTGMLGDPDKAGAISVTKLGGLATVAAIIFDAWLRRRPVPFSRIANKTTLLVCLLATVTIIAAILHPSEESSKECIRFITIVLFYIVTIYLVNSPLRLHRVIQTWVLIATVVSAYSIYQRWFGGAITSEQWSATVRAVTVVDVSEESVGVMVRAAGTFSHPGWLALYLSLTIPLTLYLIWTVRRGLYKAFFCLTALTQAGAIMATFSRTGYVALALGVALFLIRRRRGPAVLLWAALLTIAVYPFWPANIRARVESILDYTKSSSSVTRLGQQLVGWWMFRDNMYTGVGPGNFEENVKTYIDRVPDKWRVEVVGAHNMYVEVLAELGVQGLVLMLLILLVGWRTAERARRTAPDPATALMHEVLSVSLAVFAFSAVLVHAQYQKEWWLLLALIAAGGGIARRFYHRPTHPRANGPTVRNANPR